MREEVVSFAACRIKDWVGCCKINWTKTELEPPRGNRAVCKGTFSQVSPEPSDDEPFAFKQATILARSKQAYYAFSFLFDIVNSIDAVAI